MNAPVQVSVRQDLKVCISDREAVNLELAVGIAILSVVRKVSSEIERQV